MTKPPIHEAYIPTDKATWLIRQGLGRDLSRMSYYVQSMQDPERMAMQIGFSKYVGEVLNNTLQWIFSDPVAYSRLSQYLISRNRPSKIRIGRRAYESLQQKSSYSKIPLKTLIEVYNKGYEDVKKPIHLTNEQYAWNRVNSYISGGHARKLEEQTSVDKRQEATTDLSNTYKNDTPGQKRKTLEIVKRTTRNKKK